jgi:GH15 family glucan-1,4-alpha-glucosidase
MATAFHALPLEQRIRRSYSNLEKMRKVNGGYVASLYAGDDGAGDAYNVYWIRDILYASYANEYVGCFDKLIQSYRLALEIFKRYHRSIIDASIIKPDIHSQRGLFMPARVHPTTFNSLTDEWGHHQLDVFGLFMYKMGDLIKKGFGFEFSREDYTLVAHIRDYIFNMGFEADYGMWEEGPEEHSSSFGAVLGGLMMWFDQGFYDYKYKRKVELGVHVPVSERMIADGYSALSRLLPNESNSRPYDLAQMSLIWPYNIVDLETKRRLLDQIETHLVRPYGVIRYPHDKYIGKGTQHADGEPAQWPLGLAWLAICYAKFAEHGADFDAARNTVHFSWEEREAYFNKAVQYFAALERVMTPDVGFVPEMYVDGEPGHNTPLAWAQSFHIIAGQSISNLASAHPHHFKLPEDLKIGSLHAPTAAEIRDKAPCEI